MVLGWPGINNGNEPDSQNSICCFSIHLKIYSFIFQISAKTITGNSWGLEKEVVCNPWQQILLPGL